MALITEPYRNPDQLSDLIDEFYTSEPSSNIDKSKLIPEIKTSLVEKNVTRLHSLLLQFNPDIIPAELQTSVVAQLLEIASIPGRNPQALALLLAWTEVHQLYPMIGSKILRVDEVSHNTLWLLLPQLTDNVLVQWFLAYDSSPLDFMEHWLVRIQHFNDARLVNNAEMSVNRVFKLLKDQAEEQGKELNNDELQELLNRCQYHEAIEIVRKLISQVQGYAPSPSWVIPCMDNYGEVMAKIEQASELEKFRVLGPINPLHCSKECGGRMLACNCIREREIEDEEEEEPFFTGECEVCLKKIKDVAMCVRKISSRGWKGVYCSWTCVTEERNMGKCAKCKKEIGKNSDSTGGEAVNDWEYQSFKHLGQYHRFCSSKCSEGYVNQKTLLLEIIAEQLLQLGIYVF